MMSEISAVVLFVMIVLLIVWLMIKRDMFEDSVDETTIHSTIDFKNLSSLQKIIQLENKVSELNKLLPSKSQIELLRGRLLFLKKLQSRVHLMYLDEIMQYRDAIAWLERMDKNLNK